MGAKMITSALVLALTCAYAAGGTALAAAAGDDDCALYLTGPGRSSAYDYSLNLLKGNFGYDGQHTCITYEAVNQAYIEARQRIVVSQPKGEWKPEDYASVGELILDISIHLARTYGLTYEEIEKGLPLIDTSRTLIREVCPPVFSHVECRAGKYRRLDGLCNNLQHPTWGATNAPFQRLIGPLFADGINAPRISHSGRDLPLSRVVSRTMHPDDGFHDHAGTVMVIAWGQFMDHDYTLTGTPLDPINRNDPEECCKRPPHLKHPYCNEIRIPDDDYFYRLFGVKCIDFVRGFPSPRPGCRLGSRVPFNTLTGAIDGNTVYGVTDKFARKLRTGYGGLLRMNPVFNEYGLKDLLPLKLDIPDEGCTRPNKNMYCFEAGEIRVNEQLVLAVMHTLMAREHNRVANGLAAVNQHWDDETLYQEARRINIAEIQHITYNEFLPILLGKDVMEKFGLVLEKEAYWDGHDPSVNPDVIDAFAAAAYRFGHSLLPTAVERWSKAHKFIASKRLSDLIRRPYDLYRAGVLDEYVMGLMNQVAQAMDDSITQEVTNHLFKKVGARFGMDLVSFNMQRGREFGLPGYMEFRKFCGLPGADSFQDLFGSMSNETIRKYESIFEHPIDVDLWSGGVSERPLPGSMLGPTFACIIATQFSYSRRGDRFWYELPNQPSSFTPEQLAEVKKARLARVICDNTDIIDTVQLYPMVLPDHELNPRVPCRSGIIPSMDFSKWAEPAPNPFHSGPKRIMTEAYIAIKNETDSEEPVEKMTNTDGTQSQKANQTLREGQNNDNNTVKTSDLYVQTILETKADIFEGNGSMANDTDLANLKCIEGSDNCIENKSNTTRENDTVLNYVYKNDDINLSVKLKGHPKNSIHRKKRSTNNYHDHLRYAASAPLIVSYKTVHDPRDREPLTVSNPGIIQNAQLADFNIETLHESQPNRNSEEIKENFRKKYNQKDYPPKPRVEGREIDDEDNYRPDRKILHRASDESSERSDYRERKPHTQDSRKNNRQKDSYSDSNESGQKSDDRVREKPAYDQDNSGENYDRKRDDFTERDDSREKSHYTDREGRRVNSDEINENYRKKNGPYRGSEERSDYRESDAPQSREDYNSGERGDYPERPRTHQRDDDSSEYIRRKNPDSNESSEKSNYRDKKPPQNSQENDGSDEQDYPRDNKSTYSSSEKDYPPENKDTYSLPPKDSNESSESDESYPKRAPENQESEENNNNNDSKSAYTKPGNDEVDSRENKEYSSKAKPLYQDERPVNRDKPGNIYIDIDDKPKGLPPGNDDESEEEEEAIIIMTKKNRKNTYGDHYRKPIDPSNNTSPFKIQDVDLGDFSYERIQVNDNGDVEPAKETHEKYDVNHKAQITPITTFKPELNFVNSHAAKLARTLETGTPLISHIIDSVRRPTEIPIVNGGEVRPVVELHGDKDDSNEENTKQALKANPDENQSLETILGVKESIEQAGKIIEESVEADNGDVKQEFERIPLNYNHDNQQNLKENTKENVNAEPITPETITEPPPSAPVAESDDIPPSPLIDDALEEAKPLKYDDNLNIKFDDVPIKLPEIKLPGDILSYIYEEPDYVKEQKKQNKFYTYDNAYENDDPRNGKKKKNKDHHDDFNDEHHSPDIHHPPPNYYGHTKEKDRYKKPDKENDDDYYHSSYYGPPKEKDEYREEEKQNPDYDDEDVDLYEKFVRERFGKRGSFEKRSENLAAKPVEENPKLYKTLQKVFKKTENIEKEAAKSGDPNAGYMWTLEYGQNL